MYATLNKIQHGQFVLAVKTNIALQTQFNDLAQYKTPNSVCKFSAN